MGLRHRIELRYPFPSRALLCLPISNIWAKWKANLTIIGPLRGSMGLWPELKLSRPAPLELFWFRGILLSGQRLSLVCPSIEKLRMKILFFVKNLGVENLVKQENYNKITDFIRYFEKKLF